jgi:G:T/U-mismatch repair DNA glycosylase
MKAMASPLRIPQALRPMDYLLQRMPHCQAIVTTGQKASEVIAEKFGVKEPAVGEKTLIRNYDGRQINFWRMPSSSRAYPLALEKKAEHYRHLFETEEIL